jgi:uncharacterized protein (DUF58 family)
MSGPFVSSETLMKLEQTSLAAKRKIRGTMQGKRKSQTMGSSLEFADYRLYVPGDDIRQLDWNAYARTGKPFIKLFLDEQELQVNVYVDASKSMDYGANEQRGGTNKFWYARQLAACIGYITLSSYDRLQVNLFGQSIHGRLPSVRGKGSAPRLMEFLAAAEAQEESNFEASIMNPAYAPRLPGMAWVFSDFLVEFGVEQALSFLQAAKQEVVVVQVLSPDEWDPKLSGDLNLLDSESGLGKEVAMTSNVLKEYSKTVQQYTLSLQKYCFERGMSYMLIRTDVPVEQAVFQMFRSQGLLS